MNITERIERTRPYFGTMSIASDAICLVVKFPENWRLPKKDVIKEVYKTVIEKKDGIYFFLTELENGQDCVFDALDKVISLNKEMEDKNKLLVEKCNELKEIFMNENLEKLMTLKFTFDEPKSKKAQKQNKRTSAVKDSKVENKETSDITVKELTEETNTKDSNTKKTKDSSLMTLVKSKVKEQEVCG